MQAALFDRAAGAPGLQMVCPSATGGDLTTLWVKPGGPDDGADAVVLVAFRNDDQGRLWRLVLTPALASELMERHRVESEAGPAGFLAILLNKMAARDARNVVSSILPGEASSTSSSGGSGSGAVPSRGAGARGGAGGPAPGGVQPPGGAAAAGTLRLTITYAAGALGSMKGTIDLPLVTAALPPEVVEVLRFQQELLAAASRGAAPGGRPGAPALAASPARVGGSGPRRRTGAVGALIPSMMAMQQGGRKRGRPAFEAGEDEEDA